MSELIGLSHAEALQSLKKHGFNEIAVDHMGTWLSNAKKVLLDPMGLMLLILGVSYLLIGQKTDAIILFIAYIPIIGVDVLLELRSQTALRALRSTVQKLCYVIRDGKTLQIPVREIVPQDLVVLEEGLAVPADGRVAQFSNLTIDESALTGESIPVAKTRGDEVLSGTTVLTGQGVFRVEKTGAASQIGAIGKILQDFNETPSPLLKSIQSTVGYLFLIALILAAGVMGWSVYRGESWGQALIVSLTLAMAAIPEEFPLVFTLYLSMAAYRLSKKGILVKSITAVEGLGRTDVICTDKTGTLTQGRFQLERLIRPDAGELTESEARALVFACELKAVDAMEAAISGWITKWRGPEFIRQVHEQWQLVRDYPFDPTQKYMTHVWRNLKTGEEVLAMKGAVEGVLAHCQWVTESQRREMEGQARRESEAGMRLLALAVKSGPLSPQREVAEQNVHFVSLLIFSDPVRPRVEVALKACQERAIEVKMLTGDHLLTAHSIADRIGFPHSHDQLYDGPTIDRLNPSERDLAFDKGRIFARLKPEHKLDLIRALQSRGAVVAMAGDGINDGPALKLADVGISMGESATDVARSSAQLVLLKSDFSGILDAVLEGERVLQSLRESFGYLIAFHLPIIFIALAQAFFFEVPMLLPIHIVLLELVVHPVSAFAFDRPLEGTAKPRQKDLISKSRFLESAFRGAVLTALSIYLFVSGSGALEQRRSLALTALILGNIGLVWGEKRDGFWRGQNLIVALLLMAVALALTAFPPLSAFFHLQSLTTVEFVGALTFAMALSFLKTKGSRQSK